MLKKLSVILATALPAALAYKKYSEKSEYYNQQIKTIWNSFSKENIEDLKLSELQKEQIKTKLGELKDKAEEDIYSLLNHEQRVLFDKLNKSHRTKVVLDDVDGNFKRNETIVKNTVKETVDNVKAKAATKAKSTAKSAAKTTATPAKKAAAPRKPKAEPASKPDNV